MWYSLWERVFIVQIFLKDPVLSVCVLPSPGETPRLWTLVDIRILYFKLGGVQIKFPATIKKLAIFVMTLLPF
jgi:hypothetical protein